ncbi:MAG TPA: hypothetical protein VHV82_01990 [Sporichthyaceae bacterium]|jgi:hypothetical protein|nr:hypothetical protein [Sporichthyaceae bacterium]
MKTVIEDAARAAGRHPDMVVAGHVHDYRRLTTTVSDGTQVPYLAAGAGGYHNLHAIGEGRRGEDDPAGQVRRHDR